MTPKGVIFRRNDPDRVISKVIFSGTPRAESFVESFFGGAPARGAEGDKSKVILPLRQNGEVNF